jgi:hypothetical protein
MFFLYCFQISIFALKVACLGVVVWVFAAPLPQHLKMFNLLEKFLIIFPSAHGRKLIALHQPDMKRFRLKWNIFFILCLVLVGVSLGQSIYAQSKYFKENIRHERANQ